MSFIVNLSGDYPGHLVIEQPHLIITIFPPTLSEITIRGAANKAGQIAATLKAQIMSNPVLKETYDTFATTLMTDSKIALKSRQFSILEAKATYFCLVFKKWDVEIEENLKRLILNIKECLDSKKRSFSSIFQTPAIIPVNPVFQDDSDNDNDALSLNDSDSEDDISVEIEFLGQRPGR